MNPGCTSAQLHDGGSRMPLFQCQACAYRQCINCRTPWHEDDVCPERQRMHELVEQEEQDSLRQPRNRRTHGAALRMEQSLSERPDGEVTPALLNLFKSKDHQHERAMEQHELAAAEDRRAQEKRCPTCRGRLLPRTKGVDGYTSCKWTVPEFLQQAPSMSSNTGQVQYAHTVFAANASATGQRLITIARRPPLSHAAITSRP